MIQIIQTFFQKDFVAKLFAALIIILEFPTQLLT